MSKESSREPEFKRNLHLEGLLYELNSNLVASENEVIKKLDKNKSDFPIILIMGSHRSGTTLFLQWLANTGLVAYPTNLLSRFYRAPIIGAQIQLLLTDPQYNFRNEILDFNSSLSFESENGKTKGALAPNEFWYFWRRFLVEPKRDAWTDDELSRTMDTKLLKAELAGMMEVFGKPFAAKGLLFNYNIPFLDSIFEKILFIQIKRNPITNVASILDARRKQLGSESEWYSFKIPEYDLLHNLDPVTQACGQVHFINKAVESGLSLVDENRKLIVCYEDFCTNPELYYKRIIEKLNLITNNQYSGPKSFNITRSISDVMEIEHKFKAFEEEYE